MGDVRNHPCVWSQCHGIKGWPTWVMLLDIIVVILPRRINSDYDPTIYIMEMWFNAFLDMYSMI